MGSALPKKEGAFFGRIFGSRDAIHRVQWSPGEAPP